MLASHTHGGVSSGLGFTQGPLQESGISGAGSDAGTVKGKLDVFVE